MSKLPIALFAAVAFAGAAQAQEVSYEPLAAYTMSTVQRADVHAQAVAAVKAGTIEFGEASRFPATGSGSTLTRAQVLAEAREARRLGALQGSEVTVLPTADQIAAITTAGLRAADAQMAAR